jgi:hypothetical protein
MLLQQVIWSNYLYDEPLPLCLFIEAQYNMKRGLGIRLISLPENFLFSWRFKGKIFVVRDVHVDPGSN